MRRALVWSCTALLLGACAAAPVRPPRTASLRLRGTPPDAMVTIDDQLIGPLEVVQARGVALPRGVHRISVERDGFLPFDREVVADGGPISLDVALERTPD